VIGQQIQLLADETNNYVMAHGLVFKVGGLFSSYSISLIACFQLVTFNL
jgi:hypothetical protein